jgi:hypothetical protein
MKTVRVYPVFGDDFSPGDEFSAQVTAKSPSSENSTRYAEAVVRAIIQSA